MKKLLLLASVSLFAFTFVPAQKKFIANAIANRSEALLNKHFTQYSLFAINTGEIAEYLQTQKGQVRDFELQLPDLTTWKLSISEHDILSKDYTLVVDGLNGKTTLSRPDCITYAGHLSDITESSISLTIDNNIIYGFIKSDGKEYFIEPLRYFTKNAGENLFVVYDTKDVVPDPNLKCGSTETMQRGNNLQRLNAGTNCVQTQLAIASDVSMFTRYGSAAAVQTHNIGVMNNVIWDYVNAQFTDNIEFVIVTQHISTTAATDQLIPAYTGTEASVILNNFATWGQAGNFGTTYDLAQLWTTRNIDGDGAGTDAGIVGLAYVGTICTSGRYHLLEDFNGSNPTGSGYQLRVLTSHEIGHNFNCNHDAANSGFIMQPSVGNTSTWSPASIASVDAFVPVLGCLAACSSAGVPVADFILSTEKICTGGSIELVDHSLKGPTSWTWTMNSGSPASSSIRNPTVSYATSGVKTISLTPSNSTGTGATYSRKILVSNPPTPACINSGIISSEAGIRLFILNDINNVTGSATADGDKYMDFTCSGITRLAPSTLYNVLVNVGFSSPSDPTPPHIFNTIRFYIDYNNDGDFADANEAVFSTGSTVYRGTVGFSFTTPALGMVTTDQFLRARVIAGNSASESPCQNPTSGQVEDYSVYFGSPVLLPVSLLSFEGYHEKGVNILKWQTANEKDNSHFEIETSKDGNNFYQIGKVNSKGNSASVQDYNFNDRLPVKGKNYYKLKQVDIDGRSTYSKIISIDIDQTGSFVLVYPNPVKDKLIIDFAKPVTNALVQIFTMDGKLIRNISTGPVLRTSVINAENILRGTYILQITNGTDVHNLKFIKQ